MTEEQIASAATMWAEKYADPAACTDTLRIARKLGLEESTIYNNLDAIKRVAKVRVA